MQSVINTGINRQGGEFVIQSITISDCVGPYSQCVLKGDILQCIDHAKRLGYEGVEMHMRNAKLNDYHRIKEYADCLEMKVTGIGTGMACYADGHYLTNPDKAARKEAQQVLIDFLEAANILGDTVVLFGLMKGPLPNPRERELYKDILFESLQPVIEAAEKFGNDLTIEAINRFQADYLWSADETLEFVNRFDSRRATIHLDTFHINIEDKDMERAIRICKDRIGYFHVSDSDRAHPGHGHFDFEKCIEVLYDIGYDGVLGHEYNADPDPVTAAVNGYQFIKQYLK